MKPRIIGRAFSFWIVGAVALVALMAPASSLAAQSTGTVNASVRYCTGLSSQGLMSEVGPDCVPGGATFTFYLHGDGTDDSWTLAVGDSGEGAISLTAGTYDVWTSGGPIFNVVVPENGGTSFIYGFPSQAPAPAPEPPPPSEPITETATLNVNTFECTGVVGAPVALTEIGPDCTRIGTNLDFYLWGDGTDASWNLTTSASGAVSIDLPVGGYEVLNTYTWERLGAQVPSGGTTLSIGYAAEAAPAPAPAPETATLNVNTYECTGITGGPITLVDIGPDCTRIATNLDFYLWGDGTDASWNLTTSASGPVSINLPVGDYEVVNTYTWERIGAQVPSGGTTLSIGYAAEAAPAPVETGTVHVLVYECTGLDNPGVLNEVGPDCTPTSGLFSFYLWGDGTDEYVQLSVDASGEGWINLQVGEYEAVEENSQVKMPVTVTANETSTLKFGFPSDEP